MNWQDRRPGRQGHGASGADIRRRHERPSYGDEPKSSAGYAGGTDSPAPAGPALIDIVAMFPPDPELENPRTRDRPRRRRGEAWTFALVFVCLALVVAACEIFT